MRAWRRSRSTNGTIFPQGYGRPERLLEAGARLANSAWSFVEQDAEQRFVKRLDHDIKSGAWDAKCGHLRQQSHFDGSLRLIVG
jgi:hypothetical protein